MRCGCWQCRRDEGATPKMLPGSITRDEYGGVQRTIAPYAGCSVREKIPPDSDISGRDRIGRHAYRFDKKARTG